MEDSHKFCSIGYSATWNEWMGQYFAHFCWINKVQYLETWWISYVFGSFSHPMSVLHVMHSSQFWLLTQKWWTWFHAFRTSKVYLNNGVKTCLAIWRKILWPMEMSVHLLATSGCTPSNLLGEGDSFMYKRIYVQILNLTQLQGFVLASCLGMLARERACVTFCAICAELCWVLLLMHFCFGTFL